MSGKIIQNCHYFEHGNMQIMMDKNFDDAECKNTSSAPHIIHAIMTIEDKVSNISYI